MSSKYSFFVIVALAVFSTPLLAHPGGTNAEGCHNDRKHGGYHCHGTPSQASSPIKESAISSPATSANDSVAENKQKSDSQTTPADVDVVKKSRSGICHAPGTTYYSRTKQYTAYKTLDECIKNGGREPLR